MISDDVLIRHRRDVVAAGTGDDMVVLDPDRGEFLELNRTAARIWALLDEPTTIAALCQCLVDRFDIAPAACRDEVTGFVASLDVRGLIETIEAGH